MAEDFHTRHIERDRKAGLPVTDDGTFRVIDDEGHIEIVDPAGPPGSSAYGLRKKDDLFALCVELGLDVSPSASKDDLVRALVDLDENPRFTATPEMDGQQ